MTNDTLPHLLAAIQQSEDGDFLRVLAETTLNRLMDFDAENAIGAGRHERSPDRLTYRSGYRDRVLETRVGALELKIPKLRFGPAYYPSFVLEPRRVIEKALTAVIQEAWINGVSTRRVEDLVQAMGMSGISKSHVSKLCKEIDERVSSFLDRPLEGEWPYLWLDATYLKTRQGGRTVSVAAPPRSRGDLGIVDASGPQAGRWRGRRQHRRQARGDRPLHRRQPCRGPHGASAMGW